MNFLVHMSERKQRLSWQALDYISRVDIFSLREEAANVIERISYDKENQQVIFTITDMEISSRLIAGEFPPYQQIMPNTYSTKAVFNREELLEAVKRASLFAKDNANIVKMTIEGEKLIIRAESSQLGSNSTEIETEVEGEGLTVAFNARYLLDYLAVNNVERVRWETEGELKPSVFKREEDEGWIQVVMPVRTQG